MTREQAEIKIKAAAFAVAAELGIGEAIETLKKVIAELQQTQWSGPGSR